MSYFKRVICVGLILYLHFGGVDLNWPVFAESKVDLAVYAHETKDGNAPPYVVAGMREISDSGIRTAIVDVDVVDGEGKPTHPAECEAAKKFGLPAFTVTRGGKVKAMAVPEEGKFLEAVK